jgi:hypothetical protein
MGVGQEWSSARELALAPRTRTCVDCRRTGRTILIHMERELGRALYAPLHAASRPGFLIVSVACLASRARVSRQLFGNLLFGEGGLLPRWKLTMEIMGNGGGAGKWKGLSSLEGWASKAP